MFNFLSEAEKMFPFTQSIRQDLHMHPELGFQEVRTAGVVARELTTIGLQVTNGVGKTGVVGILDTGKPGKTIMLRFDMDALPILEETGAQYVSQNPGIMHACGHDAHVAIGLTVARLLNNYQDAFKGKIKFVFQPAEEGLGGAEAMVAGGVLEFPRPDYALGVHVWNNKPIGWFGISPGPVMAASETFRVVIRGRGGHGALPDQTIDPIITAAHIITGLQSIVARNVNPLKTAVVSTTAIHGGHAFNVIPQDVEFLGTIRTFEPEIRTLVIERFHQITQNIANALNCYAEVEVKSLTPAVNNDTYVTGLTQKTAQILWPNATIETKYSTMGSEDMAFYLKEIPGCFIFVGSGNSALELDAAHHHPKFDIDERVLPMAAGLVASTVIKISDQ